MGPTSAGLSPQKDVTEVVAAVQILGNVGEGAEVIRVLGGARDVPDLVLRDYRLMEKGGGRAASCVDSIPRRSLMTMEPRYWDHTPQVNDGAERLTVASYPQESRMSFSGWWCQADTVA
ncbi:hypothetical protein EYF80_041949 [Liparis tanakae]|uniref:Uncharacterized protein n=1 Tax=Liparis tanakae TaxID=230148 RepID=A0A4Z2G461_9TELE|nr:hypothetical protein EYF80_041949 [Liparis tanakae]